MKHYKVKKFSREAKKADVIDRSLWNTATDFINLDAEGRQRYALGAGLYKLRLATNEGQGKSGGSRSILAFEKNCKIIWLHLFAKSDKGNITTSELKKLKSLADILLGLSANDLVQLIKAGEIDEVKENG